MTNILRHRGPDGHGSYERQYEDGTGVALGHTRLAIIDPQLGKQPMSNPAETIWITYNGEFYNYCEVRELLVAKGHSFRTNSDTEVLLQLYEEVGIDCLQHIRGMFAFAIWDEPRRRLFIARDRLGQKPLVYSHTDGQIAFASEIKAVLQIPGISRNVDLTAMDAYLKYLYIPYPQTGFKNIYKLPPAHYATFSQGRLSIMPYWDLEPNPANDRSPEELRERLAETLDESVRLRLRSDVPLGTFLSGGVDSTIISGLAQRNLPRRLNTYTIGFPIPEYDERHYARAVAEHLGTEHHEFVVHPDALEVLPKLAWHFDEPFGDSSAIPTYYVSQIARQHVKVVLTGDGGDELFAGYGRYQTAHHMAHFDRLPAWLRNVAKWRAWSWMAAPNRQSSVLRRLQSRREAFLTPPQQRHGRWVTIMPKNLRNELFTDDFCRLHARSDEDDFVARMARPYSAYPPGKQAMLADMKSYLPCDLLAKVDITSMAHGLECRSPFLDHHVVEVATAIPFARLVRRGQCKPMLLNTFGDFFPRSLHNRSKMGFTVPLSAWFRNQLSTFTREMLLSERSIQRGYFRSRTLERILDEHKQGTWDHGDRIWSLLTLELWHRTFVDTASIPTAPPRSAVAPA